MEPESRRTLYGIVLTALMLGTTFLFLGVPWSRGAAAATRPGYSGWYYHRYYRYGGGHGGWMGRGYNWGTFGGLDDDGFAGGGPGSGK